MRALLLLILPLMVFTSCSSSVPEEGFGSGLSRGMGRGPSVAERKAQIAAEPKGNFYYGRRYYVKKTRFWGYLRKPGQSAKKARLVIFNESRKRNPDRLPESGPGLNYGYDQNYEYKIYGSYTGKSLYEPNSNQFLPEFKLTNYEVVNKNPGWLFSPKDVYSPSQVTLLPRRF